MTRMLRDRDEVQTRMVVSLIGFPQNGKTSFTEVFFDTFGKGEHAPPNTGGIIKSTIEDRDGGFVLLDTCSYFFRVNRDTKKLVDHDERQIRSLIAGLPDCVTFSRNPNPQENSVLSAQIYSENAVTSLIFFINARVMYNPQIKKTIQVSVAAEKKPELVAEPEPEPQPQPSWFSWWQPMNWFGSPPAVKKVQSPPPSVVQNPPKQSALIDQVIYEKKFPVFNKKLDLLNWDSVCSTVTLVNACHDILLQNVDYKDKFSMPVAVVVTHVDMIPESDKKMFKKQLNDALNMHDISDTVVFYGETICKWDEEVIQKHEMEIENLMKKVDESPDEDYFDKLDLSEFRSLHIGRECCKDDKCNHTFTDQTISNYRGVIERLKRTSRRN